jgi:hypothetical protein
MAASKGFIRPTNARMKPRPSTDRLPKTGKLRKGQDRVSWYDRYAHAYGGFVITNAAYNNAKVKGLFYVAAPAPMEGQSMSTTVPKVYDGLPKESEGKPLLIFDNGGFAYINPDLFRDFLAHDVDQTEANILAVVQKPGNLSGIVNEKSCPPIYYDSSRQKITPKHILATSAYPSDNFPWVELEEGVYAWDGALLSNTPFSEVIDASPIIDKRLFFVENYPKEIEKLPDNLAEVQELEIFSFLINLNTK